MNNTENIEPENIEPENIEPEDDETQYLRSLAGTAPIFIDKDESVGGHFELFPEYED